MKKKFGKFLSILLTVAMMLSLLPATAFANGRAEISNVVVETGSGNIAPAYGAEATDPVFTTIDGKPAYLMSNNWQKEVGDDWVDMADGDTFIAGTYRYKAQLRIDSKNFDGYDTTTHKLSKESLTVKVDGKEWDKAGTAYVDPEGKASFVRVFSPGFTVKAPEGQELTFNDSDEFDIARSYVGKPITYKNVSGNVEGGTKPYTFSKASGPAWINVSEDGKITGTPEVAGTNEDLVVKVTDSVGDYKTITITVASTKINPADRKVISAVEVTSDIDPKLGEKATNPTFTTTVGKPAYLECYNWQKLVDGEWINIETNDTFEEGKYRYWAQLRIDWEEFDGYDYTTHMLSEDSLVSVKVNGKAWEVTGLAYVSDTASFIAVYSPAFTVTKPVVLALDVKGIKAPVDGETADTSGIIINNNISATKSSAQWFKETSGGHGAALEPMDASDKFVAGGTYYLSIKYEIADGYELSNNPEILHDLTDGIAEHNASAKVITIKYKVKDLGIILKDGVASWNAVDGADNYKWTLANNTIGGMIRSDEERSFDLNARLFFSGKESGTYTFTVQAFNGNEAVSNLASVEYVFTTTHTHDWDEEWDMNENYHWHNCKNDGCGVTNNALKSGYGPHTFEGDTCTGCGKNASLVDAPVITIKDGIASWTQIAGTWRYWWGLDNNTIGGWAEPGEKINLRERLAGKEDGTYSFTVQAFTSMTTPLSEKASVNYNYTETIIKTPIESVVLSGVNEPAIGVTPDFDIILTDHIESDGIYWRKLNTETENWENIDASTPFSAGKYWLKVELYSDEGYEFTTGTKFYFGEDELSRFDGTFKSNYDYEGGKPIIHILYTLEESAPEAETITELSATVTAPVAGEKLSFEATAGGEGYDAEVIWECDTDEVQLYPEDNAAFEAGKEYTLYIEFTAKDGYDFAADATITINEKTAEMSGIEETSAYGGIKYTVEAEDEEESAIVTIEMKTGDNVEGYTTAQEEALGILIEKGLLIPDMELKGFKNGEGKLLFTLNEDTGEIEVAEGLTDEDSIIYELTSEEQAAVKEDTGEDISEIRLIFVAGAPVVPECDHADKKLEYDADGHWYVCECGKLEKVVEDHEYEDATDATCKCGYEREIASEESSIVTIEMKTGDKVEEYTTAQETALEMLVFKGLLIANEELKGFTNDEDKLLFTMDEETGEIKVVGGLMEADNIIYELTSAEQDAVEEDTGVVISEIRLIFVADAPVPETYAVIVENGSGSGEYEAGETVTITANEPEAGKEFDCWIVKGVEVDPTAPTITFKMPENDVSAVATYKDAVAAPTEYAVTVTTGGNGTASANPAAAAEGETVELTATPDSGYEFEKWEVVSAPDGTTVNIENGKFTMPAGAVTVKATFKAKAGTPEPVKYKATVENGSGDGEYAAGAEVTITADSRSGYRFVKWTSGDVTVRNDKDATTAFIMPDKDVTVTAVYEKLSSGSSGGGGSTKYKVTVEDTDNGTVESNRTRASKGTTVTITVDPEAGYEVDDIVVETKAGKEVEVTDKGEGKFTFKMPAANVTVSVDFAKAAASDDTQAEEEYILLTIDSVIAWVFDEYVANDVAPVIRNERTMLPARFVAEALGGVVTWNEAEQKVTIVNGEDTIVIFIGEPFATVNGAPVELDSPAFIENSRTYLPIRFIAENMGATVTWDADARTVKIVPGK